MTREELAALGKRYSWPFIKQHFYWLSPIPMPAEVRARIEELRNDPIKACTLGYEQGFQDGVGNALQHIQGLLGEAQMKTLLGEK